MIRRIISAACIAAALLWTFALPLSAQVTSATVSGTVKDVQGGVIPGATVVLTSDARGTKLTPAITNATGDFVIPNVTADTYTLEVTMSGFKTLKRAGIAVSAGDRVALGSLTVETGQLTDTVNVTSEAPVIQAASGERSFVIPTTSVENLPLVAGRNFAALATLAPGVVGTTRQGGGGQNNIMMDGVSTMDTGNNGQLLQMNVESIAEVKVLVAGYQAEYGRSSGLQISAVTKSGTNRFHGSVYDIHRNNSWNWKDGRTWAQDKNGEPTTVAVQSDWGYSLGGPVGRPGGSNNVFFFYSHEYRPRTGGGTTTRFRVPTALERRGDFSETLDNTGALFNTIKDSSLGAAACSAANRATCFQDGGVLGRIPANRLYGIGLNILNMWPVQANVTQTAGTNYNYEATAPVTKTLTHQPAVRVDYQVSTGLRMSFKYSGQVGNSKVNPGSIPGFNDTQNRVPFIKSIAGTVNYTLNPTTFIEATYGISTNKLGSPNTSPLSNRVDLGLGDLPLLYPDGNIVDPRYYAHGVLTAMSSPFFVDGRALLPPSFTWGSRIGAPPPSFAFPGQGNLTQNRTQDVSVSLTKVQGRHTIKAGFYNTYGFKAQNLSVGGISPFFGGIDFSNSTNNSLDSGFGFANAALGIFTSYTQQSKFMEGSYVYINTDAYLQDNWKLNNRITLDYGLRVTRQVPTYDTFQQSSNFFPGEWSLGNAPALYVAGCSVALTAAGCPSAATNRHAMNPLTGQVLTVPGTQNTQAAIGTLVPGTGIVTNGLKQAGQGISKYNYTWPVLGYGPRFGIVYDFTGEQRLVVRGGGGLFFDRPDGNSAYSQIGNPPNSTAQTVRNATLQTLGGGAFQTQGAAQLFIYQYDSPLPKSVQWNVGVQMTLPWSTALDVSLVGQHAYDVLSGNNDINAVDFGAAFLPQNQDPTLAPSTVPGQTAFTTDLLRAFKGYGAINSQLHRFHNDSQMLQTSLNRRFRDGLSFGVNYTYAFRFTGNTGMGVRLQHASDGSYTVRADQADWEKLMGSGRSLGIAQHLVKGNFVWDLPDVTRSSGMNNVLAALANDWQLSGILTAGSGAGYTPTFSYQSGGGNVNLTGSPSYAPRIVIVGDPGGGCATNNQYSQFNVAAFTGPQTGSLGLESGQNYLFSCPDHTLDLSLQRNFRIGGSRNAQLRLDIFNAGNAVIFNARQTQVQYNSPTDLTIRNPQFVAADGDTTLAPGAVGTALNSTRLLPNNAGFGAVTGAQAMRSIQLTVRFQF